MMSFPRTREAPPGPPTGRVRLGPALKRRQFWALNLFIGHVVGLLSFGYKYLDDVARGHSTPVLEPLVEELTGAYGVVVLAPLLIACARRFRLDREHWLAWLPVHLAAVVAFSIAHTTWNWATRLLLFPVFDLGRYDYGIMPVRYAMEAPNDLIIYVLVVGFVHVIDRYREARARELRASRLETALVRSQLQNLQAQLHPHFLFNALNTISSVMYEDVRTADQLLARLSELLRRALQATRASEVPLSEELEVLELYLELMRARFGERLSFEIDVDAETRSARVPTMLLQPLVENATTHGMPAPPTRARVTVRGWREDGELVLEVVDNGRGLETVDADLLGRGVGLTNTAERLRGHYGAQGRLSWRNAPGGGLVVTVRLPYGPDAAASPRQEEEWIGSAS